MTHPAYGRAMSTRLPALLAVVLLLAACGGAASAGSGATPAPTAADSSPPGDIPDNQAYVSYTPPGARFSVKVPEGWSQTAQAHDIRFTDKLNAIELTWDATAQPAPAGAKLSTVTRKAGPAKRAVYTAQGQSDPVTGKVRADAVERYEFTHAGRTVVLTLSGPKGADNVDPWRIVTDSLRWR
jgi:hypothetical protein